MTDPGALVRAEECREALFASLTRWLDGLAPQIPAEAARLRPLVLVQTWPTMARLVLVSEETGTLAEVARATEEDLPDHVAVADAVERFIAAGLSALSEDAAGGALRVAARPGGGFVAVLDPVTGSARCCFAPRGVEAPRWVDLFGISPEKGETTH